MGGNSISSTPARRVTTPTVTPREKKLNAVLEELRELSPGERRSAIASLRKSGAKDLAKALEALLPASSKPEGSRPPERSGGGYVPSGGKR